jgi:Outer membrane protein beta-barrel domain
MMRAFVAAVLVIFAFPAANARADEWTVGPGVAYVSNINHVLDIYKDNVRVQGKSVDVDKAIPVGVSFDADYQMNSGMRIGVGVGPYYRLTGDVKHFELPVSGTLGYLFMPAEQASPYIKAGIVNHFASGDFYKSSTPGFLVAGGFDFARRSPISATVQVSFDASQIELDVLGSPSPEKFRSYETVVSFFVKF